MTPHTPRAMSLTYRKAILHDLRHLVYLVCLWLTLLMSTTQQTLRGGGGEAIIIQIPGNVSGCLPQVNNKWDFSDCQYQENIYQNNPINYNVIHCR